MPIYNVVGSNTITIDLSSRNNKLVSYIDIYDATYYFDSRLHTDNWDNATDSDRSKALAMATRAIDALNFQGDKTDDAQALQFPRDGDVDVPQEIKDATCELALSLLGETTLEEALDLTGILMERYSSIQTTYAPNRLQENIINGILSSTAWQLLKPFLRDPRTIKMYKA